MVSKRQRYSGAARRWLGAHAPLATAVLRVTVSSCDLEAEPRVGLTASMIGWR
jgi:hypothetical protein